MEYRCLDCGAEFDTAEKMNEHIEDFHAVGYGVEEDEYRSEPEGYDYE